MKEIRKAKIIFSKNGQGATTTKITLPVSWIKELGFDKADREVTIELDENKIIIRKEGN